ncbi:hypothetical protein GWI33_020996 [Rhynchophorus ferrugineus]|uniref:Uncharacterized protein n=1 Tax=Rhynchophorus ferrugineus TaxID=354439 RepID=A0A834LYY0_RHYFE|nr:hypothetical protein GWI33_020996 [Rhynchophorus ferrugineus]
MFCLLLIFSVTLLCEVIHGDNYTRRYDEMLFSKGFREKRTRLISFSDEGDVELNLEFSVPFLVLPVKRTLDEVKTSLITLNVASILMTGVIIAGALFVTPLLLSLVDKKNLIPSRNPMNVFLHDRKSRSMYNFRIFIFIEIQ